MKIIPPITIAVWCLASIVASLTCSSLVTKSVAISGFVINFIILFFVARELIGAKSYIRIAAYITSFIIVSEISSVIFLHKIQNATLYIERSLMSTCLAAFIIIALLILKNKQ